MQELLKAENLDKGIIKTVQDIQIKKGLRSELHVTSSKQIMQYLHSVHPCSRPDLYIKTLVHENTQI